MACDTQQLVADPICCVHHRRMCSLWRPYGHATGHQIGHARAVERSKTTNKSIRRQTPTTIRHRPDTKIHITFSHRARYRRTANKWLHCHN